LKAASAGYHLVVTTHDLRRILAAGVCLGVIGAASGCSSHRADDVRHVASEFYDAVASQRGADACALLAPPSRSQVEQSEQKPCPAAIEAAGVPAADGPGSVRVYGTMAQIKWRTEVTFLTRYGDAWRVMAAGCSLPPPAQRTAQHYDCKVEAG